MTFLNWLSKKYGNENNQFGKLEILLKENQEAPKKAKKEKDIRAYLISQRISPRMMQAFNKAHKQYWGEESKVHGEKEKC